MIKPDQSNIIWCLQDNQLIPMQLTIHINGEVTNLNQLKQSIQQPSTIQTPRKLSLPDDILYSLSKNQIKKPQRKWSLPNWRKSTIAEEDNHATAVATATAAAADQKKIDNKEDILYYLGSDRLGSISGNDKKKDRRHSSIDVPSPLGVEVGERKRKLSYWRRRLSINSDNSECDSGIDSERSSSENLAFKIHNLNQHK